MAETTEQKTVLSIDTSGSVKSVKDLKQQIKDLKDRIVELTAAGEDASKEYEELGTSMRQMKDINENAMRSSKDLGDQLAVVSGAMKGVAGAISTVTGVMGLLGVESGKTEKLMKTMVSAMSITTGIQAMESGYKSVKHLAGEFITAAKGAKTLGGAIKAAFASNPVALLITAVTTAISLFSILSDKAKETAENIKASGEALAKSIQQQFNSLINGSERNLGIFLNRNNLKFRATTDAMHKETKHFLSILTKEYEDSSEDAYNYITNVTSQVVNKMKPSLEGLMADAAMWESAVGVSMDKAKASGEEYSQSVLDNMKRAQNATEKVIERQIAANRYQVEIFEMSLDTFKQQDKEYSLILDKINSLNEEFNTLTGNYVQLTNQVKEYGENLDNYNKTKERERKSAAQEALRAAKENAKKQLEVDKKNIQDRYDLLKEQTERTLEMNRDRYTKMLREGSISEEEYNSKMLEFETQYYTASEKQLRDYMKRMQELKEKYAANRYLTQEEKDAIYTQLDNTKYLRQLDEFRREIADATYEYNQNVLENDHNAQELENTIEIQNRINEIERESFDKRLALETEYLQKKNELHRTQYDLELALLGEEREHEMELYQAFIDENAMKMSLLNDRYANGLVTEQEFNEGMNALNQEYVERELEHSKKLVEIKRNEVEQKKELQEMYLQFEQSMTQSLSTIFTNLADLLGESNEDYKGLRIAATLLDTLQGSIAAYTGMISSIPGPLGIAAGITAATGVILQGMNTIKQMNKVDAKNGATSTSSVAMQTFTTPQTATIATGMSNDYTDMLGNSIGNAQQNQRVYVVLNDINEAQGRRVQVVNSNTY